MPGTLKLPTISSLHYSHKPNPNWVRCIATASASAAPSTSCSTTATATAAAAGRLNYSISTPRGWWWCRITPPGAQFKIADSSFVTAVNNRNNHYLKLVGFRGRKISYSSSPSSSLASEDKGQGYYTKLSYSSGFAGDMGADDDKDRHHQHGRKPTPPTSSQSAKLLTLPTILTIGRVAAVPILVSTFYVDSWWGPTVTTGIFIAAAITDWLDGYIARKMNLGSAFGAFLDPVADKLMVAATLILLCTRPLEVGIFGQVPWLLTVPAIAIIGREITMSAVREWAASQDGKLSEAVAVNNLGKWKTATQMTALTILLAARDNSLIGSETLLASGVVLLYISAWLSMWSLVVYMRKIWKVLLT